MHGFQLPVVIQRNAQTAVKSGVVITIVVLQYGIRLAGIKTVGAQIAG